MVRKFSSAGAALVGAMIVTGSLASAASKDEIQDVLSKYEKTGEVVNCLSSRTIRSTDAPDDYTLLVEMAGGDVYLNELHGRCLGLAREQRYVHHATQSRMCKGDTIRVLDAFGHTWGSCGLGSFEKLTEISEEETSSE